MLQHHLSPLESGDRLTRAEFERRYAADDRITKAELIEGIVATMESSNTLSGKFTKGESIGLNWRKAAINPCFQREIALFSLNCFPVCG